MNIEQARQARNAALIAAEEERTRATAAANLEYSRTVAQLRGRFEAGLAAASDRRMAAVRPYHRAYNAAVIAAERITADPIAPNRPVRIRTLIIGTTEHARPVGSREPAFT